MQRFCLHLLIKKDQIVNHSSKYTELIAKYLAGECSPAEEQEIFTWMEAAPRNQALFEEAAKIWAWTREAGDSPFKTDLKPAWNRIEKGIQNSTGQPASPQVPGTSAKVIDLPWMIRRWSIAAAVLVAVCIFAWWWSKESMPFEQVVQMVEVQTFDKEKKELVLPDSSYIWLNENSKLAYDPKFNQREVTLEGEAFFQVKKIENKIFRITSGKATTTVLGTSFNLRAYPAEKKIEVTVETGKVEMAVPGKQTPPVLVKAGESGIFYKKEERLDVARQQIENADAWKTQSLHFNETLMKDIVETLNRYFDVQIEAENPAILECHYSSTFPQPELEVILSVIGSTLNFEYTKNEKHYLLSGKGCSAK